MKAYNVSDWEGYSDYSIIVFAESPGKAKSLALGTDEFPKCDWDFTQLSARRVPSLDQCYRGHDTMDWDNMEDRIAMVRYAGFRCSPEYIGIPDCADCGAKDWCGQYEELMEEYMYDAQDQNP